MTRVTKLISTIIGITCSLTSLAYSVWRVPDAGQLPQNVQYIHPTHFLVYNLDEPELKLQLWNAPDYPAEALTITIPMPDGSMKDFRVWQTPMMPEQLSAKYPEIRTFTGEAVGNRSVTAKFDFTVFGFHAMILDGDNTSFIDPYDNYHDGYYLVHYKKDEIRSFDERMHCEVKADNNSPLAGAVEVPKKSSGPVVQKTFNGYTLRTYRIAVSASNQYCQAATGFTTPTIAQALSKMTTTMNRVNGVYNRELSVQMNFCANEDTLIWPTNTGSVNGPDPFNSINSNGSSCLGANQTHCTNRIGTANYDLGHVFTTGGGGISSLGVVCNSTQKAKSCTGSPTPVGDGYDIDYVAHEMGHEFGSNHTFNNDSMGSCSGNAVANTAYEPGSGSSIMAYAGICPPDDPQYHSDPYFHASSLLQIQTRLAGSEGTCAVSTSTDNKLVYLPAFSASYIIPYKTPFELIGPAAVDSVADTAITYCWEQWNKGDFGKRLRNTYLSGPIFRSYNPVYNARRVFPKISWVMSGSLTNVTIDNYEGEKVPDTTRFLTFKMTVRNILNGNGCFTFPDDTVHIDAVSTGADNNFAGFKVTSQGTTGISYNGGSSQVITWNVAGTDGAPVNAATVDIFMSTDAGNTWFYYIGTYPNTGTASITVPNPPASSPTVRFKVKGTGNIFFNVNLRNITVTNDASLPISGNAVHTTPAASDINVFPVPACNSLHISTTSSSELGIAVYNLAGQKVWNGVTTGQLDVSVGLWPEGTYFARFTDLKSGTVVVKSFIVK